MQIANLTGRRSECTPRDSAGPIIAAGRACRALPYDVVRPAIGSSDLYVKNLLPPRPAGGLGGPAVAPAGSDASKYGRLHATPEARVTGKCLAPRQHPHWPSPLFGAGHRKRATLDFRGPLSRCSSMARPLANSRGRHWLDDIVTSAGSDARSVHRRAARSLRPEFGSQPPSALIMKTYQTQRKSSFRSSPSTSTAERYDAPKLGPGDRHPGMHTALHNTAHTPSPA